MLAAIVSVAGLGSGGLLLLLWLLWLELIRLSTATASIATISTHYLEVNIKTLRI